MFQTTNQTCMPTTEANRCCSVRIGSVAVGTIDVLSTVKMKTGGLSNEFLVIKRASYCKTGEQKKIGHIYIIIYMYTYFMGAELNPS